MGNLLTMKAEELTLRERTMQIGPRSSPAGWEIMLAGEVVAWSWHRDYLEQIIKALRENQ